MDRAEERAGPEDVGDQALMRGLDTALPFVRPGLSLSEIGRRSCDRPRSKLGSSPCRGPALSAARLMSCWLSFFRGLRKPRYDGPRLALLVLRLCPADPGNPRRNIEGESPPQGKDIRSEMLRSEEH